MSKTAVFLRSVGLSSEEIAQRTGLPIARVSELEAGAKASLSELTSLARGLRVPIEAIAKRSSGGERSDVRVLFRATGAFRERVDPTFEFVVRFVEAALEVLPPKNDLPIWMAGIQKSEESVGAAERLAKDVRSRIYPDNEHEPVPNLAHDLGRMGVVVAKLNQSRFEGASLLIENYPFIFVSPRFSGRMLFTVAHELGHVVAHHLYSKQFIVEKASEIGGWRQKKSELFVDAFASAFLMPAVGVGRMLEVIRSHFQISQDAVGDIEILLLARFFGVSFEVAARRCEALNLLPVGGAWSLSNDLKKKFGSAEKRAELANLPPRVEVSIPSVSHNLMSAIHQTVVHGNHSIGWVADRFGLSIDEVFAANKRVYSEHHH